MKISLTKLFAQDGKSEKYEIPLTSETFSVRGRTRGKRRGLFVCGGRRARCGRTGS